MDQLSMFTERQQHAHGGLEHHAGWKDALNRPAITPTRRSYIRYNVRGQLIHLGLRCFTRSLLSIPAD